MWRTLSGPLVGVALAALAGWLGWRSDGPTGLAIGLLMAAPVLALLSTYAVLKLLGESYALVRTLAYRKLEGHHFAFKGSSLDICEDVEGGRWLKVADVRKIVEDLPADRTLARTMPEGLAYLEPKKTLRVSAIALERYLQRSTAAKSIRFLTWLRREVIFPSAQAKRLGQVHSSWFQTEGLSRPVSRPSSRPPSQPPSQP